MIDVEVHNFQSIEHASIRIEGFTVIVGRSNIGKSALIRAMRCALTGAAGTDFVRHGVDCDRRTVRKAKKCRCKSVVRFKTADMDLLWEKGDSDNKYTLTKDGVTTEYTAVSRGTPDFLLPAFAPVKIGDGNELIQVSGQFSPIFLLGESGSVVADVLSDVAQLDEINVAMKLVASDRREATVTRTVREKDIAQIVVDLARYSNLEATSRKIARTHTSLDALEAVEAEVSVLDLFQGKYTRLSEGVSALEGVGSVTLPDVAAHLKLRSDLSQVDGYLRVAAKLKPQVMALRDVSAVVMPSLDTAAKAFGDLLRLVSWSDCIVSLVKQSRALEALGKVSFGAVPNPLTLPKLVQLDSWSRRYETLERHVPELEKRLADVEAEEREVLAAYDALGMCPTCELPMNPEKRAHG